MQFRVDYIGNERAPVVVIDNVWPEPQALIEAAAAKSDYSVRSLYYPGVRSSAPPEYARAITSQLRELIHASFGFSGDLTITDSTFSLVATPAEKLVAFLQRKIALAFGDYAKGAHRSVDERNGRSNSRVGPFLHDVE